MFNRPVVAGAVLQTPLLLGQCSFVKISLWCRHALMVDDGAFSHKIDYIAIFWEILNLKGHQNRTTGSKVTATLLNGLIFVYRWSFGGGGSIISGAYPV